jgi:hypothetical protein
MKELQSLLVIYASANCGAKSLYREFERIVRFFKAVCRKNGDEYQCLFHCLFQWGLRTVYAMTTPGISLIFMGHEWKYELLIGLRQFIFVYISRLSRWWLDIIIASSVDDLILQVIIYTELLVYCGQINDVAPFHVKWPLFLMSRRCTNNRLWQHTSSGTK